MTGNMNRIEKDTRNEPITKTGTQIDTETDTETRIEVQLRPILGMGLGL